MRSREALEAGGFAAEQLNCERGGEEEGEERNSRYWVVRPQWGQLGNAIMRIQSPRLV